MAKGVLIVGSSGTGKSASIRTLDPSKTFIINVQGKELPFKESSKYQLSDIKEGPPKEGNMVYTDDVETINKVLKYISENRTDIENVVIDDWQYCAANEFMRRSEEKGFDKFTQIGKGIWKVPNTVRSLREDLKVFFTNHSEEAMDAVGNRYQKAKTIGKLVDDKVTLEGLFSIVLFTEVERNKEEGIKYYFLTQNTGDNTAKSPMEMFDDLKIPNDLNAVSKRIDEYYGVVGEEAAKN